ncbi:hypothetical protein KDX23_10190 [Burkholderia vietnamiensis]|uniref:hypothetical protein n=1 Tax=Burkholderia vietnamiensis TaxID=60552 RepID=UPI001B99DF9F|nr:hypothetical protein [Burkholderia vietnamiensis]MBR8083113.1 hypothetical protein [Burkholderia vietnamiensis]
MKEPILSADELTHAARALLMAVIGAPHDIECASVTVHFDEKKPGHNALNQMSRRLESELAALLEKLCGEPMAWRAPNLSGSGDTWAYRDADDRFEDQHGEPVGEPLYALNRSKA